MKVLVVVTGVVVRLVTLETFEIKLRLTLSRLTVALRVATNVRCFVFRIPFEVNSVSPAVVIPASPFVELDVNLNVLSPVLNLGLPIMFGSGIVKIPLTVPVASVTKAVASREF